MPVKQGAESVVLPKQSPKVRAMRDFSMTLVTASQNFWVPSNLEMEVLEMVTRRTDRPGKFLRPPEIPA